MLSKPSAQVINAFMELAKVDKGKYMGAGAIATKIKA